MADSLFDVSEQVVVVSGGSRGIGLAIAKGFVERDATVVITGRDEKSLANAVDEIACGDAKPIPIVCDVSKSADIERLVQKVIADCGRIDTLVNVAGVNRRKPALDVTMDDYDFILDINLKGPFLLSQAVGRHMIERGTGCQINIASLNTDRPLKDVLPYAMSKAESRT